MTSPIPTAPNTNPFVYRESSGGFLAQLNTECRVSVRLAPDVRTAAALFAAAPYPERIASVIVGTGGAAGSIQLGEPLVSWLLDPDKYRRVDPRAIINAAVRGSTYHHFPDGKREMYAAALDLASGRASAALEGVRGRPAAEVVEAFFAMWRGLLTTTDLRLSCAVLAVAVAGEDSDSIAHSGHVFATWRAQLQSLFVESGASADRAHSLAALTIASAGGAVAIARAEKSIASFELVASEVADLARAID